MSGCVTFGGSISVDVSRLPKNVTSITLMTFNCSRGSFDNVDIEGSTGLRYLDNSLVVDLPNNINNNNNGESQNAMAFLWVLWVVVGLLAVGFIAVIICVVRNARKVESVIANLKG